MAIAIFLGWMAASLFVGAWLRCAPLTSVAVGFFLFCVFAISTGTWSSIFDPAIRDAINSTVSAR